MSIHDFKIKKITLQKSSPPGREHGPARDPLAGQGGPLAADAAPVKVNFREIGAASMTSLRGRVRRCTDPIGMRALSGFPRSALSLRTALRVLPRYYYTDVVQRIVSRNTRAPFYFENYVSCDPVRGFPSLRGRCAIGSSKKSRRLGVAFLLGEVFVHCLGVVWYFP